MMMMLVCHRPGQHCCVVTDPLLLLMYLCGCHVSVLMSRRCLLCWCHDVTVLLDWSVLMRPDQVQHLLQAHPARALWTSACARC